MAVLKALRVFVAATLVLASAESSSAPTETQVKAVFLFNFARFVEWPTTTFADANPKFTLCIFGADPLALDLDAVVRGESVSGRPLLVHRVQEAADLPRCQILFIPRSAERELDSLVASLDRRATLTVSDIEDASQRGVMIRLMAVAGKMRLRVNVDAVRAAHLTVSSNLLRAAEIVGDAGPGSGG